MPKRFSARDDSTTGSQIASAVAGGLAGAAVGFVLAQAFGGFKGVAARFRHVVDDVVGFDPTVEGAVDEPEDELVDDWDEEAADPALGDRVLEAFLNDPTLAERAIDIDVGPDATVELTGEVDAEREVDYAATIAGGVPGVRHVVTRLAVSRHPSLPQA